MKIFCGGHWGLRRPHRLLTPVVVMVRAIFWQSNVLAEGIFGFRRRELGLMGHQVQAIICRAVMCCVIGSSREEIYRPRCAAISLLPVGGLGAVVGGACLSAKRASNVVPLARNASLG